MKIPVVSQRKKKSKNPIMVAEFGAVSGWWDRLSFEFPWLDSVHARKNIKDTSISRSGELDNVSDPYMSFLDSDVGIY